MFEDVPPNNTIEPTGETAVRILQAAHRDGWAYKKLDKALSPYYVVRHENQFVDDPAG